MSSWAALEAPPQDASPRLRWMVGGAVGLTLTTLVAIVIAFWLLRPTAAKPVPTGPGPNEAASTICTGSMDSGCAATAARRAERLVAWLPDSAVFRSVAFYVYLRPGPPLPSPPGAIQQHGGIRAASIKLETSPSPAPMIGRTSLGTVQVGSNVGELFTDPYSSILTLEWTRAGESYRLSTRRSDTNAADAKRIMLAIADEIQYQEPNP